MKRFFDRVRAVAANPWVRWFALPAAAIAAVGVVVSATTPPPSVALAAEPLYARGARAKPTLTLALSVEFPTVGAQYVKTPGAVEDDSYAPTNEYLGYFDTESCYSYNATPGETRPTGVPIEDYRRFDRVGDAARDVKGKSLRTCGGTGFSGNFMNWATSSAIDILRFGLTGGDRVVDTSGLTVLQRAVLPNTNVSSNFWNKSNFPSKRLYAALVAGAVPAKLVGTYTGDVFVANCLNRTHFGTKATGSCDSPQENSNLGTPQNSTDNANYSGALPTGFSTTACANENGTCSFTGTKQVAYGYGTKWSLKTLSGGTSCSNAVFGDPYVGQVKACYTRDVPPGNELTPDGFFYTRVSVCTWDGSGALTDPRTKLCLRYPGGNYKPTGNLQKYSDRVRVAAFGYLNDPTLNRYGGVLRAPMKYVGQEYFDSNFTLISGANPNAEWDLTNGIFAANPDSAAEGVSGVTNYLNKFGRTGTFGQYKTYDPVGELYYESLRYLQGLSPTTGTSSATGATYGMTTDMKDGFPVYDTWTDPHPAVTGMTDYSCIKNNIVGIGDVNTHADKYIPGNTRVSSGDTARSSSVGANEPNFYNWTKIVGAFEEGRSVAYVDGKGNTQNTSNPNTWNPITPDLEDKTPGCCNNNSYYMAGVAYWANTHDIRGTDWASTPKQRPGMRVTTYFLDVNEYGQQTDLSVHMNNQFFLAAKYGGFKDVTGTGNPFKSYEPGTTNVINSNENWMRGSTGEAKNYFLSSSAADVLAALDEIFANVAKEANSIAGGAISTQRLTTSAGYIYQAQFDPADWSGDLVAYPVTADASGVVQIGASASSPWRNAANVPVGAAGKLADKLPGDRNIIVGGNPTDASGTYSAASFNPTAFKWANLDTVNKDLLRMPPYAASGAAADSATVGEARLDYLRGVRTNEAGGTGTNAFRKRGSVLGDIVNSGVAFSGKPLLHYSDQATFVSTYADRKKALFVGANDGMLHSFDADSGAELFAYVPRWIVPNLPAYTSTNYAHRSFVDGSPVVADATVNGDWKTVLVGGTGGGGQGVYALDVSRPETFGTGNVMWEFTDRDDPSMGNVIGRPQILKFRTSAPGATPAYHYFAVVASGVNNQVDDGRKSDGSPVLFIIDLSKASNAAWVENTNYYKIVFPLKTNLTASGMVGFTARLGVADEVTSIYAGDLHGQLWKLDFTPVAATNWNMTKLSYFRDDSDSVIPMYVAKDADGNRQPISMEPTLVYGPNRSIIVSFGTGKYLETSDNTGPYKTQTIYSVMDNNSPKPDTASGATAAIAGRARLMQGTLADHVVTIPSFSWGRPTVDNDSLTRSGWYFDLTGSGAAGSSPGTGERQISNFGVLGGTLVFGSVIPAVNSCDNGSGNLYIINQLGGGGSSDTSTVGILGEPFLEQVGTSSLSVSDTVGRRKEVTRYQTILQGSGGLAAPAGLSTLVTSYVGRLSWREITNFQDLRNAP